MAASKWTLSAARVDDTRSSTRAAIHRVTTASGFFPTHPLDAPRRAQVLQHEWMTLATPPPNATEVADELRAMVAGRAPRPDSLLAAMLALKPGTDRMLLEEHRIAAAAGR